MPVDVVSRGRLVWAKRPRIISLVLEVLSWCPFNSPNFNSPNSNYRVRVRDRVRVRVRDRVRRIEIRRIEKEPIIHSQYLY